MIPCLECGNGKVDHPTDHEFRPMSDCGYCLGEGFRPTVPADDSWAPEVVPCPICHGFGTQP